MRLTRLWAPYTTLKEPMQAVRRRILGPQSRSLHVEPLQQSETDQAVEDEEYCDDQIEEPRHDQNQQTREKRDDGCDVGDGQGHLETLLACDERESRFEERILEHDPARWTPVFRT